MSILTLARLQFAFTAAFHYLYPPLSIGLGLLLVIVEGLWLATKKPLYHQMARFWTKVFALTFAIGVATGLVMEFEFGTNWATYSRYVGDVFGSALAAEGIFAFFLESGFLAVLLFGWDKVGPKVHFLAACMVAFGAHFSAIWIVVANSWMQTPAGFHIVGEGLKARAEITDFWAMVFNPSSMDRLAHTVFAAWQAGAWLMVSVGAFYLLRRRHRDFALASVKIGVVVALVGAILSLASGHHSAEGVAVNQPGMLSWLAHGSADAPVTGLRDVPKDERPPVNFTFQLFHVMVAVGFAMIGLGLWTVWAWWRGRLGHSRLLLWLLTFSVLGPQIANQAGWWVAEVGRQPWIVYKLLRTSDALSKVVAANQIVASMIMFMSIYALLFAVFVFLLNEKIKHGPDEADLVPTGKLGTGLATGEGGAT